MKKFLFLITVFTVVLFHSSCTKDDIVNSITTITKGAIVLYEGTGSPGSGDYAFINFDNDSVVNNIFSNSNSGATLAAFPDGILLYGQSMFVCAQGNFGSQGRMYKINTADNKLLDTVNFGVNPYNMALSQNHLWVTNTSGESVTKLDLDLNVLSTISVGQNPSDIVQAKGNLFVAKKSYTSENSVAIINSLTNNVNKAFFNAPPVSVSYNGVLVYVSTYSGKKLYALDTAVLGNKLDSISVPINEPAIGDIVAVNINTLYVLGVSDTMFASNIGNAVYKVDLANKMVNTTPIITATPDGDIYGISYDFVNSRIYITDSKNGSNGQVRIYNTDGNLLKTYNISGSFPKRVVFKYENF